MPIDKDFLSILRCPASHAAVRLLAPEEIAAVNGAIAQGVLTYVDGAPVEEALSEGLVTDDGRTIYRVDDDIPVMLVERGIPAAGCLGG